MLCSNVFVTFMVVLCCRIPLKEQILVCGCVSVLFYLIFHKCLEHSLVAVLMKNQGSQA